MDYRKTLEQVMELLNNAEELNMNNYNEEQVRLLNDTFIEAYLFIERALAEPSDENAVLPIHGVVGRSEQLLAFAQYLHNHSYVYKGFKPETLVRRFKGE